MKIKLFSHTVDSQGEKNKRFLKLSEVLYLLFQVFPYYLHFKVLLFTACTLQKLFNN